MNIRKKQKHSASKAVVFITSIICLLSIALPSWSMNVLEEQQDGPDEQDPRGVVLPYAFYNSKLNMAFGVLGGTSGYIQEQVNGGGTAMASSNGSWMLGGLIMDLRPVPSLLERFFISSVFKLAWYDENRAYRDGNPHYTDEIAGSNNSDEDNYLEGQGWDTFVNFRFKYLLPIGHAKHTVINHFVMNRGILVSGAAGGDSYNPFISGRTTFEISPFYRYQSVDTHYSTKDSSKTNGLKMTLLYDNRDFYLNPSKGSVTRFTYARDFGLMDSDDTWTTLEFEFSKYFDLGKIQGWCRQTVLALDFWTVDTPSWDTRKNNDGSRYIAHRPPQTLGASLGGYYRMRAYPEFRFNSRAAIYYSAEYRAMLDWTPLDRSTWLGGLLQWEYLQVIPFIEVGRVNENWNITELHKNMKVDGGIGLRADMRRFVLRLDSAVSDEGMGVVFWVLHPFQISY